MATRIWFQKHTVEGRNPLLDTWYQEHFARICSPDTEVEIHTLPEAAYPKSLPEGVVRFGAVEDFFSHFFAQQAYRAEEEGYDAFVTGASQDPGLQLARSLVSIPVLGYGETAFHTAAMTGQRFAVVGFIPELAEPILENLRRMGLSARLTEFRYIANGAQLVGDALNGDTAPFLEAFQREATAAAANGAQVIIPGEGLPNEILVHEGLFELDGVPIIDPDGLVIKTAEHLVALQRLGIASRSSNGYGFRRPEASYVRHLTEVFWKRV